MSMQMKELEQMGNSQRVGSIFSIEE